MTPPPLVIRGYGAVSAAGWNAADLVDAVTQQREIPASTSQDSVGSRDWVCRLRLVPAPPAERLPRHPRLRRVSNISRFAVAAALEAMGQHPPASLGIIMCLMNGCVSFTNRFYNEVIDEPALVSPILFPETVFNAPTSHVAACLGVSGPVTTLIGESTVINEGLHLAATWMQAGVVTQCLVLAAEEADWLSAEAVGYYDKRMVVTEGAAALLVALEGDGPRIESIVGPYVYHSARERREQLRQLANALPMTAETVLIDGAGTAGRLDKDERSAWAAAQPAQTLHPHLVLGESMGCASALQLVLAASLADRQQQTTVVSMPGCNTSAYGCVVRPAR